MIKILLVSGLYFLPLLEYGTGEKITPENEQESKNYEKNHTMKRYLVEDEYFPPIFGSIKYNVIHNQFDLSEADHSTTITPKASNALRSFTQAGLMDPLQVKPKNLETGFKNVIRANIISKKASSVITATARVTMTPAHN